MKPLAKYNCIKNYYRDILWEDKYLTEGVVRFLFKKRMNNTTKISLTIELEGSTLVRKSEPEIIKYSVTKRDLEPNKKWRGKDGLEVVRKGTFKHYPLIAKPASQHINMSVEAYEYMISNECPFWAKPKVWAIMSETQRLEAHLQRVCEHVGGKSFTYEVLGD